jgi:hypothetical protein
VVEVAEQPVEQVAVGVGALELLEQVDVAGTLDRRDRPLPRVRVEVTDDQEVGVAAAGRVALEVLDERPGRVGARAVAVAEPSAAESSPAPQPEPLLLRWLTDTVRRSPVRTSSNVWMRLGGSACRRTGGRPRW